MKETRRINGVVYDYYIAYSGVYDGYYAAMRVAKKLRQDGFRARVIKNKSKKQTLWIVYKEKG